MSQLSIFEKQKHYSNKDFTCSIGKYNVVYITFRNNSWKQFTASEKIAVYIDSSGALKFDSPDNNKGLILKLKTGTGHKEVVESTRYLQINGKKWPNILDVARKIIGSYDIQKTPEPITKETIKAAPDLSEEIKRASNLFNPAFFQMPAEDFKELRSRFYYDVSIFLERAKSPEERVEIWKTIAGLYGITSGGNTIPEEPELSEAEKKWSI